MSTAEIPFLDMLDFINKSAAANHSTSPIIRIHWLRNFSVEGVEPFLKYHLYRAGFNPAIVFGNYDTIRQEILDSSSHLYQHSPHAIVLALYLEQLAVDSFSPSWDYNQLIEELQSIYTMLARNTNALIIVNTFIPSFVSEFGITNVPGQIDRGTKIMEVNRFIRTFVNQNASRFFLADWDWYIRIHGEEQCLDYRFWYSSKAPFKKCFLNDYAFNIVTIINALQGKAKKCLVLDCDNTLWGGIIGEDGLSGIKLDRNDAPGTIFYHFQHCVLQLYRRGVLILLCSKNNEDDIWDVLDNHPACLLKRSHIAAYRINWQDKVTNINALAQELNLNPDSFVFLDDNPMECEFVRTMIPGITVLHVPQKLYTYPSLLLKEGLFDTLYISDEDKQRTQMVQSEAKRKIVLEASQDIENYLASLNIRATIHPATAEEIPRIAQLTQKTNQFNLTTTRYSTTQVETFITAPEYAVFSMTVADKFGDLGLTAVLIAKKMAETAMIDTLLMSCRILGRKLEIAFVNHCLTHLEKKWQIQQWQAQYIPTRKNIQTADFWDKTMGFSEIKGENQGRTFRLTANTRINQSINFITIEAE